jgi:AGZA family xanthine/uracil permease-like MFS transporter
MGLVVLDGLLMLILVLIGLREALLNAIPRDLRRAIGAGIGLFIAFIGVVNARIVVVPPGTIAELSRSPRAILPPVTFGTLREPETLVALAGLVVTAALLVRRTRGALLLGIAFSTVFALVLGVAHPPSGAWVSPPDVSTFGKADLRAALKPAMLPLLFSILLVDFFDTIGTSTAIAEEAGLVDEQGRIPRLGRLLVVDSIAASIGGLFGASSVTSYIESAAGVAEGARTGLHTLVVAVLFVLCAFAAPVAAIVPAAATAPALVAVGFLMCKQLTRVDFGAVETALPAFVIAIGIPFTYSISHGIGYGFITYAVVQLLSGRARALHPLLVVTALAFAAYFVIE